MNTNTITAVGIDVSKGKSMVAARSPGGVIQLTPFSVDHDVAGLKALITKLKGLNDEVRVIMEHTGMYWRPIALTLQQAGFFVSVVNAMLIHDFSDNSIRKVKADKTDALKIANYGLTFWHELNAYSVEDETRQLLKIQSRQYERTIGSSVILKNGLIALLDQTFPNANRFFAKAPRTVAGHYKWVDFVHRFWHKDCVSGVSFTSFSESFRKWCQRCGYRFSSTDTETIYRTAQNSVATLPKNQSVKILITQAVESLNAVYDSLQIMRNEMYRLASLLPEFGIVMAMEGAGPITGPQLMAEIGDVRRFTRKGALVAFAGVDAPPFQSGTFDAKSRHVSKKGSPHLRKVLFEVVSMIFLHGNLENPIYCFMDKKRSEGKHYYVYTVAGAAKFLRVYYARVREFLSTDQVEAAS